MWLNASTAPPEVGMFALPVIWNFRFIALKAARATAMTGGYVRSRMMAT